MKKIILVFITLSMLYMTAHAVRSVEVGLQKPEKTPLFYDDFSKGLSSWSVEKTNANQWSLKQDNNNFSLTSGAVDTWNADDETIIVSTTEIESNEYEVSFDVSDNRYGAMASLVFEYVSPMQFYSLRMLNIEDVDYIGFYRRNNVTLWEEENLTLVEFPGGIRVPGKTYNIKVSVTPNEFRAYVDGYQVTQYSAEDMLFDGAKCGIFQSYGEPSYDNFRIYVPYISDDEFEYNCLLMKKLGFWKMEQKENPDDILTKDKLNYFISKICNNPDTVDTDDGYVTTEYATEEFLKVLGYNRIEGTSAYYNAKQRLLRGIYSNGEYLLLKDFMQMAVNSFDIDIVEKIYGTGENYVISKDTSILNVYHNVYFDTSVIVATCDTAFGGYTRPESGEILFENGFSAYACDVRINDFLGYNVKYFYTNENKPELIYFKLTPEKELFLYSDEIVSYEKGKFSYILRGSEKTEKVKIPQDIDCIYNGVAVNNIQDYMLAPKNGDITLIDNDGNGGFDVAVVMDYTDAIVERVDADGLNIYDKLLSDNTISLGLLDNVDIRNNYMGKMDISDIYKDDVISVAKSHNGKRATILVNRKTASGTITSLSGKKDYLVIDGEKYYLSDNFFEYSKIAAGDTGILYLNANDCAVYFEHSQNDNYKTAYLIEAVAGKGLDKREKFLIFDGEIKEMYCQESLKIGDRVFKSKDIHNQILTYCGIIDYKLNPQGEISHLIFPRGENIGFNDGDLVKMGSYTGGRLYKSDIYSFSGVFLANAGTKVFLVPYDRTRYDQYRLVDMSYFKNDTMYHYLNAYSHGANIETAEYIVSEFNEYPQYLLLGACVLEGVCDVVTDSGDIRKQLTVRFDGSDVREVVLSDYCSLGGVQIGDVLQYSINLDGQVHEVVRVFDSREKELFHYGNTEYNSSYRMVYGTVKEIREKSFIFEYTKPDEYGAIMPFTEIVPFGCPITLFDSTSRGNKFVSLKKSDLNDEIYSGYGADNILIRFEYGIAREIIVYR